MKFTLVLTAIAAASFSSPALADICGFSIAGLDTASFELDCSPTKIDFFREGLFIIRSVPITLNGDAGTGEVLFNSGSTSGGLALSVVGGGGISFAGDPLFAGYEGSPTFVPGDYIGTGEVGGPTIYNISIRNVTAAVPEPATWAMMLLGFGTIGVTTRHRRRRLRYLG
ncbi:PEPxxWA-CTERM sorting domain-containing protein [Sphingomonas glaciei]|uniref:PEPxxWA-CTERM sorting domain-containing protein n=1 Tax=Sphingomonas glaciei TaxID=2938948 RepID=A0ABY5MYP6_9SPHN|nr:PEPxxWA-CTERM sorting domain-containing protein [Sphingomonas glaciei]UUR08895.1 PEPxxWA-CTERM sorting domain-containing protein [Sphingomonas glaciei]